MYDYMIVYANTYVYNIYIYIHNISMCVYIYVYIYTYNIRIKLWTFKEHIPGKDTKIGAQPRSSMRRW